MSEPQQTISPAPAEPAAPASTERRFSAKSLLSGSVGRNLGLVLALAALFVVGAITAGDRFTNIDNILVILRLASIIQVAGIRLATYGSGQGMLSSGNT